MSGVTTGVADPRLPGLAVALDRSALLELMSAHLPECRNGTELVDGRVADVQYVPGKAAQVLWKIKIREDGGRARPQLVSVKVLRDEDAAAAEPERLVARYRELRERRGMARTMPLRTPWLRIPPAHLVVHAFPLDPALPTLLDAMDPQAMREALHRAWQPRGVRVRHVHVDTLSYTPEARAALRIDVLSEDRQTGLPESRRLVGKLHVRRTPARLFAGHWAVWRRSVGQVSVAPPVGYIAVAQVALQEFLDGTRLSDLAGQPTFPALARETARSLAYVHSLTLPLLAHRGPDKELSSLRRWIGILSRLSPAQSDRLGRLEARLHRELAERTRVTGTVHADFHLANVLVTGRGVTLIDWDQASHGDPMVDVARVLASLRVSSLRVNGTVDGLADAGEDFLRAYLDRTGEDERRARLFEAAALLIAAAGPFRLQRAGWAESADLMLDEVERSLALSMNGRPVAGTDVEPEHGVPFAQRSEWALDRTYAQALLVPVVHESYGEDIEITECLPRLRDASADRLHVRWDLKGYRGKSRWRGRVEGWGFRGHTGRGLINRLHAARPVVTADPGALQLPEPIGHLDPLGMIVSVAPQGEPILQALATRRGSEAMERVARALARFGALDLELTKERETARELRTVRRRLERLEARDASAGAIARDLFRRLEPRLEAIGERRAPVALGLRLRNLVLGPAGISVTLVDDVVRGEPALMAAEVLVQLRARAAHRGESASAADGFAVAYAQAAGMSPAELAAFETLLLLGKICREAGDLGKGVRRTLLEASLERMDEADAGHDGLPTPSGPPP
jgi:aminoglycoside phosphotransferase (APT) family kinase protein